MQPAAPDIAGQPGQPFAARVLQEIADRMPGGDAGPGEVPIVDVAAEELRQGFARKRLEYQLQPFHWRSSGHYPGGLRGNEQWPVPARVASLPRSISTRMAANTDFCGCFIRCTARRTASSPFRSWC